MADKTTSPGNTTSGDTQPSQASTKFANLSIGLDAAFCNVVGLVFVLTGAFMSEWLGIPGWLGTVAGIVILAWALVVTLYANRRYAKRSEVRRVLKGNLVWIALAIIVLVIPGTMSSDGKWLVAIGTSIVAAFAIAQFIAQRSLPADESVGTDEDPAGAPA